MSDSEDLDKVSSEVKKAKKKSTKTANSQANVEAKASTKRKAEPSNGPANKKSKTVSPGLEEGKRMVLQYMTEQNRPYSYLQVFENLHQVVKKVDVVKILDSFAADGTFTEWVFGKAKVYVLNQDRVTAPAKEEVDAMDDLIVKKTQAIAGIREQVALQEREYTALLSDPTNQDAQKLLQDLDEDVQRKQVKLAHLASSAKLVAVEDMRSAKEQLQAAMKEWKKRRSACRQMVDLAVGDNDTKPVEFMISHGIETDEDAGASVETVQQFMKRYKLL